MDTRTNSSEVSHFVVSTSTSLSLAGVDKDTTPETCVTTHVVACYIFFFMKTKCENKLVPYLPFKILPISPLAFKITSV